MPDKQPVTDDLATSEPSIITPGDPGGASPGGGTPTTPGPKDLTQEPMFDMFIMAPECLTPSRVYDGFLGQSSCGDGWWRLYSSLEFNEYIEFHEDQMLQNTKIVAAEGALVDTLQYPDITRTLVWIRAGARVRHHRLQSHEVESDFVRGPVSHENEALADQFRAQLAAQFAEGSGYNRTGNFSSKGPC